MPLHTHHRRRGSRVSLALLGTIAAGSLVGAVTVSPPPAGAATSFTALAAAEGIRVSPYAGGAPVANEPVELGVPVAQAIFDSLGTSQSFSSAVYPGDLLVSLPGLVAGVSGGQLTCPTTRSSPSPTRRPLPRRRWRGRA